MILPERWADHSEVIAEVNRQKAATQTVIEQGKRFETIHSRKISSGFRREQAGRRPESATQNGTRPYQNSVSICWKRKSATSKRKAPHNAGHLKPQTQTVNIHPT